MDKALAILSRHINKALAEQTRPLFLVVDDELKLLTSRGNGQIYGLPDLAPGKSLAEPLALIATATPEPNNVQLWRFVELPTGAICHIHLLRIGDAWGVILLDANDEHAQQQASQQLTHELLLLREERERLIGELETANRLRGEFIARMSHEFRTPLASVIGYSDELSELKADDPDVQYHLGAVGRGGRYLLNLVENLLDQARIEAGQLVITPAGCDLHDVSDEVEQLLRPVAHQKQLSLAWFFGSEVPPRVWIDATRLKQILINLVGNAIKFTKTGSVNVEFDWSDGHLSVVVEDTGPGISDADAAKIFQPFQQAGGAHTKGAGLGLAISRTLVHAMGGDLRLQSEPGRGSRFCFDIEAPVVRSGRDPAAGGPISEKSILIVDDDADLSALFKRYLSSLPCTITLAGDADSAYAAFKRSPPDLVLMDLNLGLDGGRQVARQFRKAGFKKAIVAISADDNSMEVGQETDFDARWSKPISRARLFEGVRELLGTS